MKRILLSLTTIVTLAILSIQSSAQVVGGSHFLKGRFVEIGICDNGGYGSTNGDAIPDGYHERPTTSLGFVADPDMDGWETGTPGYIGDFFVPGTPQEGWDVYVDGNRYGGWRGMGTFPMDLPGGGMSSDLDGENTVFDTVGTKVRSLWEGAVGDLAISIRTSLDTNRVFFIGEVTLKNTGTTTLNDVFFDRTVDPDNEAAMSPMFDYTTDNTTVYQPDETSQKCLVTAIGRYYDSYLGLGAVDCRAKCYIITGSLYPSGFITDIFEEGGQNGSGSVYIDTTYTADVGIGVIFNIGDIAPGDSATVAYAYILREADLDSAFAVLEAAWLIDDETSLASGSTTVKCVGSTMDVDITGGGAYVWGDWFPTTGLSETSGPSTTITVGTDTITYRVVGTSVVCPQNDTLFITVFPEVVPPPGEDSSANICANHEPVDAFEYIGGDPTPGGTWEGPGVTPAGIFDPSSAGIGVHELIYTKYEGECRSSSTVTMNVFNYVDVDFNWSIVKGCAGDTINFVNNSEEGTYKWNYGDGTPYDSGVANPSHFYEEQGEYGAWLIVRNLQGCVDSAQKLVDTKHPLAAIFSMDVDSVCQNGNISFLDNSVGSVQQWNWDFGDGTSSTTQSPTHNYTLAGYHTVRLIVTDDVPCSDTTYGNVYIDSIPTLEILTDKTEVCNGERINMGLNFLYTANGFTWNFGDGTDLEDGSGTTFHSYNQPGEYIMQVRSHHPVCADAIAYDTFTVKPYPVVNLGPDTTLCLNGAPVFISSAGIVPAGTTWRWSTGDTTAILKVVHPGTYVANADLDGCTGSDEITVTKDCYTDVPNSFTPNGDGTNDYFYPRQLITKGVIAFNMTVFDRWGQKIFETNSINGRGWDGKMNDKDQPVGVYIYMINVVFENNTTEKYTGNVTLLR